MMKGFNHFASNGGKLTKLQFYNMLGGLADEQLYQILRPLNELKVLQVTNCILSVKEAQTIGKIISDFQQIQELDLTDTGLNDSKGKEIADGLMRAKQLEILKLSKNINLQKAAS